MAPRNIVVVGASLAGLRGAEALRRLGFDGRLSLVGAEAHRPYDRPPLSKEVLRGTREPDAIALTKPDAFDALDLDLHLGTRAESLDLDARTLALSSGAALPFDGLLIATGAAPRTLPGAPTLPGVYTLRTLEDCLALRAELDRSPRVAVVGAGFIGAEVAATCRQRELDVVLIEALPAPMASALGEPVGELLGQVHRDHGVDVRCGVGVRELQGGDRVEAVRLADGSSIAADVVVVGIGVAPETNWLESSGLELEDGVVCDHTCATRAPGVVAAGDVARWHNRLFGESMRVEHWTHAVEQGEAAAARLLASDEEAEPFSPVPFVWSDQYDRKVQTAGRPRPGDETFVAHGSFEERRFVTLYGRKGRLIGALAMNRVRQLMAYRRMIREGTTWEDALAHANAG
jgi:NADPH-dependent 2,4-dienoyl-CoA reductase/sulfur reductase-like enzyme